MRLSARLEAFVSTFSPFLRGPYALRVVRYLSEFRAFRFVKKSYDPNILRKTRPIILKENFGDVDLESCTLSVNLNDHIGYHTYLNKAEFDATSRIIAEKIGLTDQDIFLDIGANIGSVCVPLCSKLGCECIAIEASNRNASLLLRNLYQNNISSTSWARALVAPDYEKRFIELHTRDGNTGANSIKSGWNPSMVDSAPEIVRVATLDDLISDQEIKRIKLTKIDVEGAEEDVLRGASKFLEKAKCPIILEYRIDATKKYLNSNYDGMINILTKSFNIFALSKDLSLTDFDKRKSYENIIAIPKEFELSKLD